ncbi:MAG: trigger factor family protein, partial [Arcobacter sp.]
MEFNAKRVDEANAEITATMSKATIDAKMDKIAKEAAKTMNIQGFRKGKVPVNVVKARYGEKLSEDAANEVLRDLLQEGLAKLEIANDELIGEPGVSKFDKKDNGDIDVEVKVSSKPKFDLGDYKSLIPAVKEKKVAKKDLTERLENLAKGSAPLEKIKRK